MSSHGQPSDAGVEPFVALLGPVRGHGPARGLTAQQLSLVAFLAIERQAGRDAIINALWGGHNVSAGRFANLLVDIRAGIGRRHLPDLSNGGYRLAGVATDIDRFKTCLTRARKQPEERLRLLESALTLVRGVPFANPGGRHWGWVAQSPGLITAVETMVADTAIRAADLAVAGGEPARAAAACQQGLLAVPLDETLTNRLAGLQLTMGRPQAAKRLLDDWESQVEGLLAGLAVRLSEPAAGAEPN